MDKDKKDNLSLGFRRKLEDYELLPREDLWAEIERDLSPAKRTKRSLWITIGSVAASIALILSLSWGIFKTLNNPASDIAQKEIAGPNQTNHHSIVHEVVETKGKPGPVSLMKGSPKPLFSDADPEKHSGSVREEPINTIPTDTKEEKNDSPEKENDRTAPTEEKSKEIFPGLNRYIADIWDDIPSRSKKKKDLSLALAYANQGNAPQPNNMEPSLRMSELFSQVLTINGEEKTNNVIVSDKKYKTPITFSLSVRKFLTDKWSLESGLAYTYLESSDVKTYATGESFSNTYEVNYLGIPLKLGYSIFETGNLTIYASGGGMIEKNIYARKIDSANQTKEKLNVPELQWSIGGNAGMNYEIFKKMNLFIEPGVSYYFDNKSEIPTIRKDKPLNFNLQLGLRLDL